MISQAEGTLALLSFNTSQQTTFAMWNRIMEPCPETDAPSKLWLAFWRVVGALRNITGYTGSDFTGDVVSDAPYFTETQRVSKSIICAQSEPGCVQVAAVLYHKWLSCSRAHMLTVCMLLPQGRSAAHRPPIASILVSTSHLSSLVKQWE
jgi:hypothetical protein